MLSSFSLDKTINLIKGISINPDIKENIEETIKETIKEKSSWFSFIGLCLLGGSIIIGFLCISDIIAPNVTQNIPGVKMILEPIYNFGDYIKSFFFSDLPDSPTDDSRFNEDLANRLKKLREESLNLSPSSSSSSNTVLPPTPKPSRPNTPFFDSEIGGPND
jgi:hypothetical protein